MRGHLEGTAGVLGQAGSLEQSGEDADIADEVWDSQLGSWNWWGLGSGAVPMHVWGQRGCGPERLRRDMWAACIPRPPERTQRRQAGRTGPAWMRAEGTGVGGTTPGAWQERWMEGRLDLGSGLAVCARAGGGRGICRGDTWAWSRPGRRRAEDEHTKRGARHRLQLVGLYLDAKIKEEPQDVDVCREKEKFPVFVTSGERCRRLLEHSRCLPWGRSSPHLLEEYGGVIAMPPSSPWGKPGYRGSW